MEYMRRRYGVDAYMHILFDKEFWTLFFPFYFQSETLWYYLTLGLLLLILTIILSLKSVVRYFPFGNFMALRMNMMTPFNLF
jgi:hypothetical protein